MSTEYFYITDLDEWQTAWINEIRPDNRFSSLFSARQFIADELGDNSPVKIIKRLNDGTDVEQERFGIYDCGGIKHNPQYRYIVQFLVLTDGYGKLLENGGQWELAASGNDIIWLHHYMKVQRRSERSYGYLGEICRIMDTETGQVLDEYNDIPEKDEQRKQDTIRRAKHCV